MARTRQNALDKPIKPGRIGTVLATLGREIAQDIIPVGTALPPEPDLEARFGVGRGVVREVVKTLAAKGLVSVRPRHGTHVLPRRRWSLLDRDVLSWLIGQGEPDRDLLLAIQEVRSIIEPAAAALAAQRATKNDRERINAALAAMEASKDHVGATAADKAFHLAILDATHNPVLQGFRGAIDTILSTVFVVAIGSAGWFRDNLPNHAAAARAIDAGDAEKARVAMERVLGYTKFKISSKKAAASGPTRHRGVVIALPRQREDEVQVMTEAKTRRPWIARSVNSLRGAAMFVAPLLALVAVWAIVVPLFQVNPRVFPSVGAVGAAALESIRDGTLIAHVGASLLRVGARHADRRSSSPFRSASRWASAAGVSAFLTPLFRFFSVLAGIAWIPIATLWFGYGFGAIIFVIFNAVFFVVAYNTLLGVSTIPHARAQRGGFARCRALGDC